MEGENNIGRLSVLQKINTKLEALGISDRWKRTPEYLPEYELLKEKRVVIVDDVIGVIANLLPEYISATDGSADAVYHTKQNITELVAEILAKTPDIILMDYNLANDITGIEVVCELQARGFVGKIVGHSSEGHQRDFERVGAIGCINKTAYPTSSAIMELAKLMEKSQKK